MKTNRMNLKGIMIGSVLMISAVTTICPSLIHAETVPLLPVLYPDPYGDPNRAYMICSGGLFDGMDGIQNLKDQIGAGTQAVWLTQCGEGDSLDPYYWELLGVLRVTTFAGQYVIGYTWLRADDSWYSNGKAYCATPAIYDAEGDADGDGVPNGEDSDPNDSSVSTNDSDGDGIDDDIDPYPDDPAPFMFRITYEIRNGQGDIVYWCMETNKGDTFCYGDGGYAQECWDNQNDCETKWYLNIGGVKYDYSGSQLGDMGLGWDQDLATLAVKKSQTWKSGERVVQSSTGIQSGVTSTGTETDNEALRKIVDNTGVQVGNQQRIADYLKGVDQGLMDIEQGIRDINSNLKNGISVEGGEGGASAGDIASAIDQKVGERETSDMTEVDTRLGEVETPEYSGEFGTGDVPEKTGLPGIWDSFLDNNPVSTALSNSGIDTSGGLCSISFEYGDTTVELTICDWQEELNAWGTVLLALTGLISIIIIVRG